jgi:hypothetical protein
MPTPHIVKIEFLVPEEQSESIRLALGKAGPPRAFIAPETRRCDALGGQASDASAATTTARPFLALPAFGDRWKEPNLMPVGWGRYTLARK